jgi:uncharacterized protein YbgA (DUF1722 family)
VKENHGYLDIENQVISEEEVQKYILERFEEVKNTQKIKNLVNFQAMNKYMLMAHDQEELKKLGKIVASYKKIPFSEILDYYEMHLGKSFEKQPTVKKHTNVILHVFGHFSNNLSHHEKKILLDLLEQYRKQNITLGKLLAEIHPIIFRYDNTYLSSQTYFLLYSNIAPGIFSNK